MLTSSFLYKRAAAVGAEISTNIQVQVENMARKNTSKGGEEASARNALAGEKAEQERRGPFKGADSPERGESCFKGEDVGVGVKDPQTGRG